MIPFNMNLISFKPAFIIHQKLYQHRMYVITRKSFENSQQ